MDEMQKRFANLQKKIIFSQRAPAAWDTLKNYLIEYGKGKSESYGLKQGTDGRYCIAISIEDLLKKMEEIEIGDMYEK